MSPLRVACRVEGRVLPGWQAEFLEMLGAMEEVTLTRVILAPTRLAPARESWSDRLYDRLDRFVDRGRHRAFDSIPLESVACVNATPGLLDLVEETDAGMRDGSGATGARERLRACALDLLIALDGAPDLAELAAVARLGAWGVRFDGMGDTDETPGRRAMQTGGGLVSATLLARGEGPETVLGRAVVATHGHSLRRTSTLIAEAVVGLLMGRVRALLETGETTSGGVTDAVPAPARSDRGGGPFLLRAIGRIARRSIERSLRDEFHWSVGVAVRAPGEPLERLLERHDYRWLSQPDECFHADPFVIEHEGEHHLFVERFDYRIGRGLIAASRIEPDGAIAPPRPVLERPYHLSYPGVFAWGGRHWMIPETGAQRTVELYRCERWPDRWELDRVLLKDVDAADATVCEHDGRLWMFVALGPRGMSADTELHLFHAGDPRGPWHPHPANPVVSDVRHARPAGTMWREGGGWIRPAQDCSGRYGAAVTFCRVIEFTPERYREEPIGRLTPAQVAPGRGAEGVHTWNTSTRYIVTDVTRSRWRRPWWRG